MAHPHPTGLGEEVRFHRRFILEVRLAAAALDLVERRLGDVDVAVFDELAHLPVEEGEQQRADVGAVDVGVRHDDDAAIAELLGVELRADATAERADDRLDLVVREHLVEARLLDVEDLAPQREDGLEGAVAALLGRPARGVTLDEVHLTLRGVALLAVGELAGQIGTLKHVLAPGELAPPCGRHRVRGRRRWPWR